MKESLNEKKKMKKNENEKKVILALFKYLM